MSQEDTEFVSVTGSLPSPAEKLEIDNFTLGDARIAPYPQWTTILAIRCHVNPEWTELQKRREILLALQSAIVGGQFQALQEGGMIPPGVTREGMLASAETQVNATLHPLLASTPQATLELVGMAYLEPAEFQDETVNKALSDLGLAQQLSKQILDT